ncbi:hypothetical protein HMPREF1348_01361 [Enterococcus faecium 505]|uniref:Uncharacterized protein n=1 Tax=Enterococcus faecium 505 TaxID=1134806 RepID=J6K8J3_ENTFC|nr:hypothetical protein HMPREF1348_01361 [Enterococcus faecium 505]
MIVKSSQDTSFSPWMISAFRATGFFNNKQDRKQPNKICFHNMIRKGWFL